MWRALDERLGREVAVKLLTDRVDEAFRERFTHEARRAASVSHPNVVAVYDEGTDGGDAFMVMEYVRGRTLRELVAERGPLPPHEAARLVAQVAAALDAAHDAGVVHLDVKPANVIVNEEGVAKLTDFGVAVAAHGEAERELVGTARYVAPERLEGRPATPRSDVYGVGLLAFELLAGRPAYQGVETEDLLRMRLEAPAPSLRAARLGISTELDRVVARALARDPFERHATAGAFARAFTSAAERGDETVPLGAPGLARPLPPSRPARRGPAAETLLAGAAIVLVLLAVLALFLRAPGPAAAPPSAAPTAPAATAAGGRTTPTVIGLRLRDADRAARAAGYIGIEYDVDTALRGRECSVQRQEPAAGAAVPAGGRLRVFYVAGKDCLEEPKD